MVKGLIGGQEVCRYTLRTAAPAVKLEFDAEEISVNRADVVHKLFTVRAKDAEGIPVFRESAKVTFQVTGPAEIAGVDNGDLCSCEPYDRNWMHLYRGQVSTVLRFTGEAGRVVLTAAAEGLYADQLIIHVK
ncbi:hypothetical protein D3C75_956850 [compost metagenome]